MKQPAEPTASSEDHMEFENDLERRIRGILSDKLHLETRKMFGGVCFLLRGHMLCGIAKGKFVARIGPDAYEEALQEPHVLPMDFTGKPLKGMVYVLPAGIQTNAVLTNWIDRSIEFVNQLPSKKNA